MNVIDLSDTGIAGALWLSVLALGDLLQFRVAGAHELSQITSKDQFISEPSQDPKWQSPCKRVSHQRAAILTNKLMDMLKRPEIALGHLVDEQNCRFKLDYLNRQLSTEAQSRTHKCNRLPKAIFAGYDRPRFGMDPWFANKSKTHLDWSIDLCLDGYFRHGY